MDKQPRLVTPETMGEVLAASRGGRSAERREIVRKRCKRDQEIMRRTGRRHPLIDEGYTLSGLQPKSDVEE